MAKQTTKQKEEKNIKEVIDTNELKDSVKQSVKKTYTLINKAGIVKYEGIKDIADANSLCATYGLIIKD